MIKENPQHIQAVIFDLDGVLLSTDEYHFLAWKSIADCLGIAFDAQLNNRLRGVSRMESLEIILAQSYKKFTQQEKTELAERKNSLYRGYLDRLSPDAVSFEVRETLIRLKDGGTRLAIGSSSKNAKLILDKTRLTSFFEVISDGTNIQKSKPDPEVFLWAANKLHLPPNRCLVVEDAEAGLEAALSGGFKCAFLGQLNTDRAGAVSISALPDIFKHLQRRQQATCRPTAFNTRA